MSNITLTKEQLDKIREEMFNRVEMLTDEEVKIIAKKVDKRVNLPFVREEKELVVFIKLVKLIDRTLYQLLPNEYYELIRNSTDGISPEEAKQIKNRLTPLLNNIINIPVLSERQEKLFIGVVLSIIINAMIIGFKLDEK